MVKYQDIYQELKSRIHSQIYTHEQKLPDGKTLAREFGCSEITLKKAMDILVKDGLLVRKRGSGSYVKQPTKTHPDSHLLGTKASYKHSGKTITTRVLRFKVLEADADIVDKLKCQFGDIVYDIMRVRVIDGVPSIIEHTYMPVTVIPNLTVTHVKDSIYDYIQNDLKYRVHSANMMITIGNATPEESDLLSVQVGEHLVCVEQNAYLDNGQLFEYSIAKHTCDTYQFKTMYVRN